MNQSSTSDERDKNRSASVQSAIAALRDLDWLFREYHAEFTTAVSRSGQEQEVLAAMFDRAYRFGRQTIGGMILLIGEGAENALLACTLLRAFYETSLRVLWASISPHGWPRLQMYYADENRKWAEEAKSIPGPIAAHAEATLTRMNKILEQKDAKGEPLTRSPSVQQLLREIRDRDIEECLLQRGDQSVDFDYTNIYRMLCRPAHSHMVPIARPEEHLVFGKYVAFKACAALVRAHEHVVNKARSKEDLEPAFARLMDILTRHPD